LCEFPFALGILENRKDALSSIDREPLARQMADYFDPAKSLEELPESLAGLKSNMARFDAKKCRRQILETETYNPKNIRRFMLRPFDDRWCYYTRYRPLWNESRPQLVDQLWEGNACLVTRRRAFAAHEGMCFFFTRLVGNQHAFLKDAYYLPIRLRPAIKTKSRKKDDGNGEFGSILHEAAPAYDAGRAKTTANLSPSARAYFAKIGIKNPDADAETAALLWMHALAIGYSPAYLAENVDDIRQDWPRIPLPTSSTALIASVELGKQVTALLDTETHLTGVANGNVRPELKTIAVLSSTKDLSLTTGWGHAGQNGVTMPGKGKLETRGYTADELASWTAPAERSDDGALKRTKDSGNSDTRRAGESSVALRLPPSILGQSTHDVFLNESACWRNVPEKVWDFTIGGYQVIKKWLSYREFDLLGRALTPDEAREVSHMARRIAALILLQSELDANYQRVKAETYSWKP
jgi:hypothetical protein